MIKIIIILNILICFCGTPLIVFLLYDPKTVKIQYILKIFLWGLLTNFLAQLALNKFIFKLLAAAISQQAFWDNPWIYGFVAAFTIAFAEEITRLLILFWRNDRGHWTSSDRRNTIFALGEGWWLLVHTWGIYSCQLFSAAFLGEGIESYGLTVSDLMSGLIEAMIIAFMFVGLTFLTQYGIKSHKIFKTLSINIGLYTLGKLVLYVIPYRLGLPWVLADLLLLMEAAAIFIRGRRKILSLNA